MRHKQTSKKYPLTYIELQDVVRNVHPAGKIYIDEAGLELPEAARHTAMSVWLDNVADNEYTMKLRYQLNYLRNNGFFHLVTVDEKR